MIRMNKMNTFFNGLILVSSSLLVSCATTSPLPLDNFTPAVALPSSWSSLPSQAVISSNHRKVWWQGVEDNTLTSLIQQSLKNAPDVRQAIIKLKQSRVNESTTHLGYFPTLSGSLSTSRQAHGKESLENATHNYSGSLDASWEIPIFNGQGDRSNAAHYDVWTQALNLAQVQVTLMAEVATQYINIRSAQGQRMTTKKNLAKQEESLEIMQYQAEAGLITQIALETARANVAQAQSLLPELEKSERNSMRRLAVLSGLSPQSLFSMLEVTGEQGIMLPVLPSSLEVDIPMETLRQRPDVRSAEMVLMAEQSRSKARNNERWPSLSLGGRWSWQSLTLASLGGSANLVRGAFAKLSTNIFDGGEKQSRAELQTLTTESAWVSYEKTLLTALEDMENALDRVALSRLKVNAMNTAQQALINANDLARVQYRSGLVNYFTLLDSDRTRLTAENNWVQSRADEWLAHISLYKAMGGDWIQIEDSTKNVFGKAE